MVIAQDQLKGLRTLVFAEDLNNAHPSSRIFHNGSDFVKCDFIATPESPRIVYYRTNGEKAASFVTPIPNAVDLSYDRTTDSYYLLSLETSEAVPWYAPSEPIINYDNFEYNGDTRQTVFNSLEIHVHPSEHIAHDIVREYLFFYPLGNGQSESLIKSRPMVERLEDYYTTINYDLTRLGESGAPLTEVDFFIKSYALDTRGFLSSFGNDRARVSVYGSETVSGLIVCSTSGMDNLYGWDHGDAIANFEFCRIKSPYKLLEVTAPGSGISIEFKAYPCEQAENCWYLSYLGSVQTVTGVYMGTVTTIPVWHPDFFRPTYYFYSDEYLDIGIWYAGSGAKHDRMTAEIHLEKFDITSASGEFGLTMSGGQLHVPTSIGTYTTSSGLYGVSQTDDIFGLNLRSGDDRPCVILDNFFITSGVLFDGFGNYSTSDSGTDYKHTLRIDQIDSKANFVDNVVTKLDVVHEGYLRDVDLDEYSYEYCGSGELGPYGYFGSVVDPVNQTMHVKVGQDLYNVDLQETYDTSGYNDENTSGITVISGFLSETGIYSMEHNKIDNYIQYIDYDENTEEINVKVIEIAVGGALSPLSKQLFLDMPDWGDYATTQPYQVFLHDNDHETMFYFRKHGDRQLNPTRVEDTDGVLLEAIFTSEGTDFIDSGIQPGDIIKLWDASPELSPAILYRKIESVIDENTLVLVSGVGDSDERESISYRINSNAELLQFDMDREFAAFVTVNVDDYSLRAGTSDYATVLCEVTNVWGDPLEGKTVSFVISQGNGSLDSDSEVTNISGTATTVYRAGDTPGPIDIVATVADI